MHTVRSADGTSIAYQRRGTGQPLLLVGGGLSDHTAAAALLPHLEPHFTVYSMDRRGRGASGDAPAYAVEREVEDLAAVLAEAGAPAFVYGHSSGAVLVLEAAFRGLAASRLVLYEPPFVVDGQRPRPPADLADRLEALVAAGDRETALATMLREGPAMPEPAIEHLRATPAWPAMLRLAHTGPYDIRITNRLYLPRERLAGLRTPTLVLQGGASPGWMRAGTEALAAALPDGRLTVLPALGHDAARDAPRLLAERLVAFLTEPDA